MTSQSPSLSWYLFTRLLHLSLKFRLPKISRKETPSWLWSQNSEKPRIFQVTGANQNAQLFTDLVNTKLGYIYTWTDCFPCRQEKLSGIARTHVHKAPKSEQKPFRYVAILFQLRRRRSFAALQKSGQNHLSYVWTETLSDMVFVSAQDSPTRSSQSIIIGIDNIVKCDLIDIDCIDQSVEIDDTLISFIDLSWFIHRIYTSIHQEMKTEFMPTANFLTIELQFRDKGSNNYHFKKNR